jgi:hypothetical protein
MVATPLGATDRYVAPETTKTYLVDTLANYTSPLRAELDAGIDLTAEIATATGWELTADNVAVPDGGSLFTSQVPGRINPGDAAIAFYASRDTADVRDVIERGDEKYVIHLHGGDVEGQKMDIWPVRVRSVSAPIDYAASSAAMINILFAITGVPAENVAIPAAA